MIERLIYHSLYAGHTSASSLDEDDYIINFPLQSDQTIIPWTNPLLTADLYPAPAQVVDSLSDKRYANGRTGFTWTFDKITPLMLAYLRTTFATGGTYWGDVTVLTYDTSELPTYWHARVKFPHKVTPVRGAGFGPVALEFARAVRIADPT